MIDLVTAMWRSVLVCLICTFVLGGFLVGIAQYPNRSYAPFLGVTAGLFSAFCWGCTGMSFAHWRFAEIEGTTGILNIAAAVFAATAVGYLVPQEACSSGPDARFRAFICSFYPGATSVGVGVPPTTPH